MKGNVFESYEASQDNRVFTFHMRKGLKWSDGDPVDTEDVRFHFEDYMFNEELVPSPPAWFRVNGKATGEPGKVEILDEYTFTVTFPRALSHIPNLYRQPMEQSIYDVDSCPLYEEIPYQVYFRGGIKATIEGEFL
ncbi:MAG: ABC transporter substrate-binding protein [Clostridia bacterium]